MVARTSRKLLLIFLAVFVIGSISFPSVRADVGSAAAAVVDDEDGETLDMDEPAEVEEKKEEKVVVTDEKPAEVVEKEAEPEPEAEPESEPVSESVVEEDTSAPAAVEEEKEGTSEEIIESETASPNKISIPFLDKLTKQDVKKIAAFSLGAWGAATGVGWAMQQFGGDQKYD